MTVQLLADSPQFDMAEPKDLNPTPEYTPFEIQQITQYKHFLAQETGYVSVQSTKPLTIGFALHDSPIGLLSWITDKLFLWSDCSPRNPCGYKWTYTELITWTLLHYFATDGPTTALAIYAENIDHDVIVEGLEFVEILTGVSAFAGESEPVPRAWVDKKANVVWWREHGIGGHFPMYERPVDLVEDVVDFVKQVLTGRRDALEI